MDEAIGNRYHVVAKIGAGGMGTVYRGVDTQTNQAVAIKHLKAEAVRPDLIERFRREGEALRALNHPNIVKLLDTVEENNQHYLIIEYVSGGDLNHLMDQGRLDLETILRFSIDLADALTRAHKLNIIHRDLKPANVLIADDGSLRLTDFGVAYMPEMQRVTQADAIVGTVDYLPPEALTGELLDARADLWSFGVMLFEMIAGQRPFSGQTAAETITRIGSAPTPDLEMLRPDAPATLVNLVYRMLERDRQLRVSSVRYVGAVLEDLLYSRDTGSAPELRFQTPVSGLFTSAGSSREPITAANPFFHRGPIRDPRHFFDRDREVRQAVSLLANGQSLSLIGPRRIGKTSLLFHLADPETFAAHGLQSEARLFVYLDCGTLAGLEQSEVHRALLEEVSAALPDPGALQAPDGALTFRAFEQSLARLLRQGWTLIFALDEFELMSQNPALGPDFFSGLRALASRYPLAYVTASKQPLLELTYANTSALSSPFFNIFATIRLPLFAPPAAADMLAELAGRGGVAFGDDLMAAVLDLAGAHPLFLQMAGFHAFEMALAGSSNDELRSDLRRRFLSDAHEHFIYAWRGLSDSEQRTLAILPDYASGDLDLLRGLEQQCLVVRADDSYACFSPAFLEFVQRQPVAGLLQAGGVTIDRRGHHVRLRGQLLNLTGLQFELLAVLVEQAGQVVANEALEQALWGDHYVEDPERLKSVIKGLRRALGDDGARLENVRGIGYRFGSD